MSRGSLRDHPTEREVTMSLLGRAVAVKPSGLSQTCEGGAASSVLV